MTDGKRLCCNCLCIIKSVLQPILIFVVLDIVSFIPVPSYFNYINIHHAPSITYSDYINSSVTCSQRALLSPDDLKAVTKRLIVQAKRQGSCDNISIIVVFLKDPRDIAADNRPPMDLG